jgi:hypothetical protein
LNQPALGIEQGLPAGGGVERIPRTHEFVFKLDAMEFPFRFDSALAPAQTVESDVAQPRAEGSVEKQRQFISIEEPTQAKPIARVRKGALESFPLENSEQIKELLATGVYRSFHLPQFALSRCTRNTCQKSDSCVSQRPTTETGRTAKFSAAA